MSDAKTEKVKTDDELTVNELALKRLRENWNEDNLKLGCTQSELDNRFGGREGSRTRCVDGRRLGRQMSVLAELDPPPVEAGKLRECRVTKRLVTPWYPAGCCPPGKLAAPKPKPPYAPAAAMELACSEYDHLVSIPEEHLSPAQQKRLAAHEAVRRRPKSPGVPAETSADVT